MAHTKNGGITHAREDDETPTWRKERFEEIISEIDVYAPEIIICVTTSGRNWSDLSLRTQALSVQSPLKPELASLTLGSMNFAKKSSINSPESIGIILELIYEKKMIPELEIFDLGMVNYANILVRKGLLKPPFYFNIILGSQGTADFNATNIAAIINSLPNESTWALAGIGRYQLQANIAALTLGGHVRVGLEDNPYYDWKKRDPTSNVQLVERIVRIGMELGLKPASPEFARSIIGLPVKAQFNLSS